MDALGHMERMKLWEKQVENHCLSKPEALAALYNLLTNVSQQISDRDAEIQRLRDEVEIAEAVIQNMGENRRGIIGQAHADRADLYAAQDRLEQMGENERF